MTTLDHLHYSLTLSSSLHRHHPGVPLFVLVVDAADEPLPTAPATIFLRPEQVGYPEHPYCFLKFRADELCNAAKPFLLRYVIARGKIAKLVYLDGDTYVFAPLAAMLSRLDSHDFIVTPHLRGPFPNPHRSWERPYLGDVAAAGVFNAGFFGVRVGDAARTFLDQWAQLNVEIGACSADRGAQQEQHAFNWVAAFGSDVHLLRDPQYNVAYWNLHERALRLVEPEAHAPQWTVDGEPLVLFHFSGYSLDQPHRISRHDGRTNTYCHGPLMRLLAHYAAELLHHGAARFATLRSRYAAFPSGITIDDTMRGVFKDHEDALRCDLDPFTQEGAAHYARALLQPVPWRTGLAPVLLDAIYRRRSDLVNVAPDPRLEPEPLVRWFGIHGAREFGYEALFGEHRPAVPKRAGLEWLETTRTTTPTVFGSLARPLGRDRAELLNRLERGHHDEFYQAIRALGVEYYVLTPVHLVWTVYRDRVDLRKAFPDPWYNDAEAFSYWLDEFQHDHLLPAGTGDHFRRVHSGASLARIYSFLSRHWSLMNDHPLALVGVGRDTFARTLLECTEPGQEYDVDDVVAYLWMMDACPWAGLPLLFELPVNARQQPSPLLPDGQLRLLGGLAAEPRFAAALSQYRSENPLPRALELRLRPGARPTDPLAALSAQPKPQPGGTRGGAALTGGVGANFFGYFKSPIGLGYMSRQLASAIRGAGLDVAEIPLTNVTMDADLKPRDFLHRYDHTLGTNILLSFPHLELRHLAGLPQHVVADRQNIAYLAWELEEGNPYWADNYREWDQVWALSDFTANALRRCLDREVLNVPCILDCDSLPPAASKAELGLDPSRFTVLFTFNPNSSTERKNPEGVIEAFRQAFGADDRVRLLIRVASAFRPEHRDRLRELARAAAESRRDIQFLTREMGHRDVLRLISACDAYISLHRAEGFGYTCAEAMAYGRPTIATGYSGNLEFMTRENSYLVDYQLTEVRRPEGPFCRGQIWAEPEVEHAAALLREIRSNPGAAKRRAELGRQDVRRLLSPERIGLLAARAIERATHPSNHAI